MRRGTIAAAALLVGCSGGESPVFVDLTRLDRALALMASTDENGRFVESQLVELDDPGGTSVRLSVPAGGAVLGVAFDREALAARAPRLDPSRSSELRFEVRSPRVASCPEGLIEGDSKRAQIDWPDQSRFFSIEAGASASTELSRSEERLARLAMSAPVNTARCGGHPELRLRPFAPDMPILRPGVVIDGAPLPGGRHDVNEFVRVDEERMLLAYGRFLLVAERGVGFVDVPERFLRGGPDRRFRSFAVGPPDPETAVRRVVFVHSTEMLDAEPTASQIVEASLDGFTLTRGSVLLETTTVFDAVHIDQDTGQLLLYERPGQIYSEERPGGPIVKVADLPDTQPLTDKRGRFRASMLAARPVSLIGSRPAALYLGTADGTSWVNAGAGLTLGWTYRSFAALANGDVAPWLHAGNTSGELFERRLSETEWRPLEVRVSPELIPLDCAIATEAAGCGFARSRQSWTHLHAFEDARGQRALVATSDLCSIAYVLSPDGCASHFVVEELGPLTRDMGDEIVGARTEAGMFTLVTEQGTIFEFPLAELSAAP